VAKSSRQKAMVISNPMNRSAIELLGPTQAGCRRLNHGMANGGQRGQDRGAPGFTLLEILLAITIFAIVITTIFGSFRAVFFNSADFDHRADLDEMANGCLTRMSLDLESLECSLPPLYHPPGTDDEPDIYRVVGDFSEAGGSKAGRLRFTSLDHLSFHNATRQGVSEIVYYLYTTADGQQVIKRADHLYPYPDFEASAKDATLCEKVKSLKFVYFDQEGDEHDRWDSESDDYKYATPTAIGIQIEVGDENYSRKAETVVSLPVQRREIG
jgi:general secretion pathway protein J